MAKAKRTAQKAAPIAKERDPLENARNQAYAQLDSIRELVAALRLARENDDSDAVEEAEQRIREDVLSGEVRTGWIIAGRAITSKDVEEFRLLLCTGGPAVQIVGDVGEHGEPSNPRLQCQDWFQPWTDVSLCTNGATHSDNESVLIEYASVFYWGD